MGGARSKSLNYIRRKFDNRMKIRLILILMLSAQFVFGQTESALYKIDGNGLKEPSYIFGTVNFLPKFGYVIPDEVKKAIMASKVFVTKSDLDNKSQKKFNEAAKIPNDDSVEKYLSDKEIAELKSIIEKYGGRNQAYKNFYSKLQPVVLATSITALTLQYNAIYPIRELQEIAKDNNLKFKDLSDVDEEIAAFAQFPIEEQMVALKYAINNFDDHIKGYKRMVRAYMKEQKLDIVSEETFKATNNNLAFKKAYFDDRNEQWMPQIKKLISAKPTFIALGVPHLTGDSGLIKILNDQGYNVEPVILNFVPAKTSN